MMNNWRDIWEKRTHGDSPADSTLLALLKEDGYDTLGSVSEQAWRTYVRKLSARLQLGPGDSIFDVGCGAGALLWCLREAGHRVGGIDYSASQIVRARQVMPDVTDLGVQEAAGLDPAPAYDAVIACATFLYFPDLSYAAKAIDRMAAKATRCLALLDLPDLAQKDDILRSRKRALGEEAYNQRYAGLEHLYYSREWVQEQLEKRGFSCALEGQCVEGYSHSPYRFNAFAWKVPG
jgi:ubiquinone/menaquinone biosynthesis C-methylase UbiE